ncbi:hypothetical protein SEVIR_5G281833v4 [Setaria viridis]
MPAPHGGGVTGFTGAGRVAHLPAPPTERRRHALRCRSPPSPAHRRERISLLSDRARCARTSPWGGHQAASPAPDSDRRLHRPPAAVTFFFPCSRLDVPVIRCPPRPPGQLLGLDAARRAAASDRRRPHVTGAPLG